MTDLGWVTIPTGEFEALHWEIRNGTASLQALQRGYNDLYAEARRSELEAEALIALLRVQLDEEHQAFLAEQVATADALRELHEHDPQSCDQCSGHPLDAPRSEL